MTFVPVKIGKAQRIVPKRPVGTARLTATERQMSTTIGEAIRGLTADVDTGLLARALASQSVGTAVQQFNWAKFGEVMSNTRLPLLQQIRQTGTAEARALSGNFVTTYAFDVTDPRAVSWAAARSGELIVGISEQIRNEVRGLITSSFVNQIDPREIAREIPRQIGLPARWAQAVENSYQRNFTQFLADGDVASVAQRRAEVLAEAYRERLIDSRSMMIARTEVMTAANEGRFISWLQAGDAGLIDLSTAYKEWIAEADACEECSLYDGELVPALDDFSSDDGMPPAHPNCRCTAVLVPAEDVDQAVLDEQAAARAERDDEPQSIPGADQTVEEPVEETQPERPEPFESLEELYGAYGKENLESLATEVEAAREADRASLVPEFLKYDGLPTEVSRERFNEIATENGGTLYRGIFGEDSGTKVEQFYSGEMFHGQGAYGDGSYFSDRRETAVAYARNEESIIEAALSPEARTIDINEVMQQQEALREQARQQVKSGDSSFEDMYAYSALFADPGRTASLLGYDAITVPWGSGASREGETFTVVLNRGAVVFAR